MMSYDEYLDVVVKELQKIAPEKEYKLEVIAGEKQITTRGIRLSNMPVALDLERAYEYYRWSGRSIHDTAVELNEGHLEITQKILKMIKDLKIDDIPQLVRFKVFSEHTFMPNKNNLITKDFLDLKVGLLISIDDNSGFMVSEALCEMFKLDPEKLFYQAYINNAKLIAHASTMFDQLNEACHFSDDEIDMLSDATLMYVKTTNNRVLGATAILYTDWMKLFADTIGDDFYIIPSSVHELILISARYVNDEDAFLKMIKEVNTNQVAPDEILSYSLYKYHRVSDCVEIAKEGLA